MIRDYFQFILCALYLLPQFGFPGLCRYSTSLARELPNTHASTAPTRKLSASSSHWVIAIYLASLDTATTFAVPIKSTSSSQSHS